MGVGGGNHEGHPDLAHPLVGDAHHRHLSDVRVGEHQVLHLGRVNVEPAGDEHVLDPVCDVEVAVGIHNPDVTGVKPPVGVDRLGCLLRVV